VYLSYFTTDCACDHGLTMTDLKDPKIWIGAHLLQWLKESYSVYRHIPVFWNLMARESC